MDVAGLGAAPEARGQSTETAMTKAAPTIVNRTLRRLPNASYRRKEYLTEKKINRLIAARWAGILMSTMLACIVGSVAAVTSEIRSAPIVRGVILEGEIEGGDFEKLRSEIILRGGIYSIYLASPGGNLAEAMKIGRLVRALKLETVVPAGYPVNSREKRIAELNLKEPKNYMCASACFFVFVAGVSRRADGDGSDPILGIHRPYLSANDLKALNVDQALTMATRTRTIVERYLREMDIPAKYADQMFSISKDELKWITGDEFDDNFNGFIPGLKDWIDARCDKRTDLEKQTQEKLRHQHSPATASESAILRGISMKDNSLMCGIELRYQLARYAYDQVLVAGRLIEFGHPIIPSVPAPR